MAADPRTWMRRGMVAMGGGLFLALLLGGAAISLLVIPVRWYQAEREVRDDPARCPLSGEFPHTEVYLGAWAEPDECAYFDASGNQIHRDGSYAGPVLKVREPITRDGIPAAIAGLCIVACVGALGFSVLRGPDAPSP